MEGRINSLRSEVISADLNSSTTLNRVMLRKSQYGAIARCNCRVFSREFFRGDGGV